MLYERLAVRPQLARTLARHASEVDAGSVPRRTKELCAMMVAWLNACQNCLESHEEIALSLGVDRETLDALGDYERSPLFAEPERAALAATVALTREARALPPPLAERLAASYDEGGMVEIVATIGLHNYLTRASNALRSL